MENKITDNNKTDQSLSDHDGEDFEEQSIGEAIDDQTLVLHRISFLLEFFILDSEKKKEKFKKFINAKVDILESSGKDKH